MLNRLCLSLEDAEVIADAVVAAAEARGEAVCVAVTDATTFVQCHLRMDGAPLFAVESSRAKSASASEGRGVPTSFFEREVLAGGLSALRLPLVPIEGGEPVVVDGRCVGAVGVAGAALEVDTELAQAGVAAFLAGRPAVPGTSAGAA